MAINEIGIYPNNTDNKLVTSFRIASGDGTVAPYLKFRTQSNSWTSADISIVVDVITKSGTEGLNGFTNIGTASRTSIARTNFSYSSDSSNANGWTWAYQFANITGLSTLLGTLSYSGRSYDCLRIKFSVKCYWTGGSTTGSKTCYIGFTPVYAVNSPDGIYIDKNGLTIEYTAADWNRPNDRWTVKDITDSSNVVIKDGEASGKVGSAGKLTIPKNKLRYIPQSGDTLTGLIRMTGSWQGSTNTLNTLDLSTVTVINKYTTNTPTMSIKVVSDGVQVTVGETGSASALDSVEVSLVGSDYVLDRANIPIGESHVFRAVPVNTALEFQAVGYSAAAGELAASAIVTQDEDVNGDPVIYESDSFSIIYDSGSVELAYNVKVDTSNKPEALTVKFAGRNRPTVGFGVGGEQSWRVSANIITEPEDGLIITTEQEVRALPEQGVCILRFPDGERAQVYISSVSVSRAEYGGTLRAVDIDAEEVA